MECLGRANSAAISVHFDQWRFRRRKVVASGKQLMRRQRRRSLALLRVRASGGGVDSCVATGIDEFADEDFIKAGGSERLFVQMQERKPMEKQSKIAEKLVGTEGPLELLENESPLELVETESPLDLVGTESPLESVGTKSPLEAGQDFKPVGTARD
ncbi:hypothetical protein BHE74_00013253 [Ensete ventricosum]|nr:hypothetical protein BHE74_00013253 [Ensete ventricosum]